MKLQKISFLITCIVIVFMSTACSLSNEEGEYGFGIPKVRSIYNGHTQPNDHDGVGALFLGDNSLLCTAVEIAERCLLTAAHCLNKSDNIYYTQKAYAWGGRSDNKPIEDLRTAMHPGYKKDSYWRSYVDLGLVWTAEERKDDPKEITWNPKPPAWELPDTNEPAEIWGYGDDNDSGHSRLKRKGLVTMKYAEPRIFFGEGAQLTMEPILDDLHWVLPGDSGGPVFQDGKLIGINSARNISKHWSIATGFFNGNEKFVSLSGDGFARKFCRPLVFVELQNIPDDAGIITGTATDSLIPENNEIFSCVDPDPDKVNCSSKPVEKVHLEAIPKPGYRFKEWKGFNHYSCPCEPEESSICDFTAAGIHWSYELYGAHCEAHYEELELKLDRTMGSESNDGNEPGAPGCIVRYPIANGCSSESPFEFVKGDSCQADGTLEEILGDPNTCETYFPDTTAVYCDDYCQELHPDDPYNWGGTCTTVTTPDCDSSAYCACLRHGTYDPEKADEDNEDGSVEESYDYDT